MKKSITTCTSTMRRLVVHISKKQYVVEAAIVQLQILHLEIRYDVATMMIVDFIGRWLEI